MEAEVFMAEMLKADSNPCNSVLVQTRWYKCWPAQHCFAKREKCLQFERRQLREAAAQARLEDALVPSPAKPSTTTSSSSLLSRVTKRSWDEADPLNVEVRPLCLMPLAFYNPECSRTVEIRPQLSEAMPLEAGGDYVIYHVQLIIATHQAAMTDAGMPLISVEYAANYR